MFELVLRRLDPRLKGRVKNFYYARKKRFIDRFLAFGPSQLEACLRSLGIKEGDTVMLHSSFHLYSGFQGSVDALIDSFLKVVGAAGNLLMVSLPYHSSSYEYLVNLKYFDVNKTMSRMGMASEVFRRRKNVLRSLHPTHPVLACGPRAEWIVARHEDCLYPCGAGTPFEKFLDLSGKVVFFNVTFASFTFFHYLEDMVSKKLPFPLYTEKPFEVPVIDAQGNSRIVKTFVFSPEAIEKRRFALWEKELWQERLIKKMRIGNSTLLLAEVKDVVAHVNKMVERGRYFYEF